MKRSRRSATCLVILTVICMLFALPPVFGADGRELTKSKCKVCHAEGSKAGTVTPLSKTQKQWERFFDKGQHEKKAPGVWKGISPGELEQIRRYLIEHAADSPHPETCG
jgi:hypothetical protein